MRSLKENAIAIKDLSTLNDKIYKEIEDDEVLMVGELHGKKEPSEFAFGLCKFISDKEENAVLALEIPTSQMDRFSIKMSLAKIKELVFFKMKVQTEEMAKLGLLYLA